MHRIFRFRPGAALAAVSIVAVLVAAGQASGAAKAQPTVVDGLAAMYLQYSAWAGQNDLDPGAAICVGDAGARKGPVDTEHTAFRCRVTRAGKPAGVVIATALGPEWLKVTRIVSGTLKPDRGIGTVPKGPEAMVFSDAEAALTRSSWARTNKIGKAFCTGVGPYKKALLGLQFGAFSCATYNRSGQRSGTVLVQVLSSSSLRLARKLS